jgi:hypothetical protein
MLGYKGVYHMREVFIHEHYNNWMAVMEAKYEGKGKLGREEFDEFLGNYMVNTTHHSLSLSVVLSSHKC